MCIQMNKEYSSAFIKVQTIKLVSDRRTERQTDLLKNTDIPKVVSNPAPLATGEKEQEKILRFIGIKLKISKIASKNRLYSSGKLYKCL